MSTTQPPTTPPTPPADGEDPYSRPLLGPETPRNPHPRRCKRIEQADIDRWNALPPEVRAAYEDTAKAQMDEQIAQRRKRLGS